MTADAWYFTRGGERLGPVSFTELREKVADGGLNPRLDMVWKTGMEAWQPSGEIDGLFERAAMAADPETGESARAAPAAAAAPAASKAEGKEKKPDKVDPYAPASAEMVEQLRQAEWPGARRRGYLFMVIVFPMLWNIGLSFALPLLGGTLSPDMLGFVALGAALVPIVVSIVFCLKRFTNLGMSRWWFFGQLVPFLNLWVGYRLFACPAGYRYHKKLDGAGVALAILYWLSLLAVVGAMIAMVVLFAGMASDPELQQKLQEFVENLQAQAQSEVPAPEPQQ